MVLHFYIYFSYIGTIGNAKFIVYLAGDTSVSTGSYLRERVPLINNRLLSTFIVFYIIVDGMVNLAKYFRFIIPKTHYSNTLIRYYHRV